MTPVRWGWRRLTFPVEGLAGPTVRLSRHVTTPESRVMEYVVEVDDPSQLLLPLSVERSAVRALWETEEDRS